MKQEKEDTKYTVLDEIKENEIPKALENQNDQQQQQVPQTPASVVRRSTKLSRPPKRYSSSLYYAFLTDSSELEGYGETIHVETKNKWDQGMKNETWDLVQLLVGKRALHNKWVYRLKEEDEGKKRYKASLL